VTENRWSAGDVPRGADYDRRFEQLAASGHDVHGEAALVDSYGPGAVLDAGCGTGRVAIELHRRGHLVVGVDADAAMLEVPRRTAPELTWVQADLADPGLDLGRTFDVIVLAGNVLIFVAPGTEASVIAHMAAHLHPGGRLIAGYTLQPDRLSVTAHDRAAGEAGLELEDRWSTWDRAPFTALSTYAVSVHRRPE
jgi:SAM-dependent methyltransferase